MELYVDPGSGRIIHILNVRCSILTGIRVNYSHFYHFVFSSASWNWRDYSHIWRHFRALSHGTYFSVDLTLTEGITHIFEVNNREELFTYLMCFCVSSWIWWNYSHIWGHSDSLRRGSGRIIHIFTVFFCSSSWIWGIIHIFE